MIVHNVSAQLWIGDHSESPSIDEIEEHANEDENQLLAPNDAQVVHGAPHRRDACCLHMHKISLFTEWVDGG